MKKNKGFTLVELLAVIAILAVIVAIAFPVIGNVIESSRQKTFDLNEEYVSKAAKTYTVLHSEVLPKNIGESVNISLQTLIDAKAIEPVKDVKDNSECNQSSSHVKITKISDNEYTFEPCLICANYSTNVLAGNKENHQTTIPDGYVGIYTVEDLNNIRNNYNGNYILMNDLDFNSDNSYNDSSNKSTYTSGEGWLAIGDPDNYFTGNFDGNNYTINNLFMNRPTGSRCGLFGVASGVINNIGLENANISCDSRIGVIVGSLEIGTIRNSYATGSVTGNLRTGGLVGNNYNGSLIENCYSNINVTGGDKTGGISGYNNSSTTKNSFSMGNITGTTSVGPIAGEIYNAASVFTNNYRNKSADFTGTLDTVESANQKNISSSFFQEELFINSTLDWDIEDTWYIGDNNYPTLGGTIDETNSTTVYNITTIEELFGMHRDLDGDYTLMNDLDFDDDASYSDPTNKTMFTTGEGWLSIGFSTGSFTGTFNGNNHVIKNLYINQPDDSMLGLFSDVISSASIQRLGLTNIDITGKTAIGGLIGYTNTATINNSYVTGNITGTNKVGGLVGDFSTSTINNSYSTVNVTGEDIVGSLVGTIYYSNIYYSFGAGNIESIGYGGILGGRYYSGSVVNCYRNSSATITAGNVNSSGTLESISNLQNLSSTGLTSWDTDIWQTNSGAFPTFK